MCLPKPTKSSNTLHKNSNPSSRNITPVTRTLRYVFGQDHLECHRSSRPCDPTRSYYLLLNLEITLVSLKSSTSLDLLCRARHHNDNGQYVLMMRVPASPGLLSLSNLRLFTKSSILLSRPSVHSPAPLGSSKIQPMLLRSLLPSRDLHYACRATYLSKVGRRSFG